MTAAAARTEAWGLSATGSPGTGRRLPMRDEELLSVVQESCGHSPTAANGTGRDGDGSKGNSKSTGGMPPTIAVTNLCNTLLGSGVLALASTAQEVGATAFAVAMTVAAIAAYNTHVYLYRSCIATKTASLEALGRAAFRHWGARLSALAVIVQGFGSLSSYTILVAELGSSLAAFCAGRLEGQEEAYAVADSLVLGSGLPNRVVIVWLVIGCVVLPAALLPTLTALRRISQLGVGVFIIFVAVTATTCATATPRAGELRLFPKDRLALLMNCPTLLFALNSHHTILTVFAELQPAPGKSLLLTAQEVSRVSYAAIWLIYLVVGLLGYWAYRDSTRTNLLMNMPPSTLIVGLRGMMLLSVVAGYPNIHFAVRRALLSILLGPEHPAVSSTTFSIPQVAITLVVVCSVTIFALLLPGLKTAFALTGATSTSFLMLVFPAAVFLRVHGASLSKLTALIPVVHIVAGLSVAVLCVGAQIHAVTAVQVHTVVDAGVGGAAAAATGVFPSAASPVVAGAVAAAAIAEQGFLDAQAAAQAAAAPTAMLAPATGL